MSEFIFQINYDEKSYAVTQYTGHTEDAVIPASFLGKPVTLRIE